MILTVDVQPKAVALTMYKPPGKLPSEASQGDFCYQMRKYGSITSDQIKQIHGIQQRRATLMTRLHYTR